VADSIFGRNSYLQDSLDALKRLPAGVLRRLSDTPGQVARGVLGPAYRPTMAAANIMGPQADVAGMVRDAEVGNRLFGQGKYGPALANYGMAAAAVPFMFLPGGVTAFKGGPSQFAPKALEGVSARAERAKLADDAGRGKTREEIEIQGGALKSNVGEHLGRILDDHNIEWSYHENGGITAIEEYTDKLGRAGRSKKYFSPNASLGTVRNWLGY